MSSEVDPKGLEAAIEAWPKPWEPYNLGLSMRKCIEAYLRVSASPSVGRVGVTFQQRVESAHEALFHDDPTDLAERRDRFYEEANETVQALGMSEDDAHRLVSYTFNRPPGDVRKEIGAAALTLASLCVIGGWDMMECAEADLEKLQRPETIARIRAKRSTRHGRGPLPGVDPTLVYHEEPAGDTQGAAEPVAWQHRGPRGGWITTDEKTQWSERALYAHPAALVSPPDNGGWMPIETAPKDGTKFDAWQRDRRVVDVYWSDVQDAWSVDGIYGPEEPAPLAISPSITHWRPLPAPPSIPQESKDGR